MYFLNVKNYVVCTVSIQLKSNQRLPASFLNYITLPTPQHRLKCTFTVFCDVVTGLVFVRPAFLLYLIERSGNLV